MDVRIIMIFKIAVQNELKGREIRHFTNRHHYKVLHPFSALYDLS